MIAILSMLSACAKPFIVIESFCSKFKPINLTDQEFEIVKTDFSRKTQDDMIKNEENYHKYCQPK
jgi:hypothetical protein